MSVLTEGYYD